MDLENERVITKEEGDELSKKRGCRFIESSGKNGGWTFDQLYQDLLQQIMKKKKCKKKRKQLKKNENN